MGRKSMKQIKELNFRPTRVYASDEPTRESVFAKWREAADRTLSRPLCLRTQGDKSVAVALAGGRKVAVRFIAARHLPRYRSARGVVRHRDIFSDPTMPKAGESHRRRRRRRAD